MKTENKSSIPESEKIIQNTTGIMKTKSDIFSGKKRSKITDREAAKYLKKNVLAKSLEERLKIRKEIFSLPDGRTKSIKMKVLKTLPYLKWIWYVALIGTYFYLVLKEYYL